MSSPSQSSDSSPGIFFSVEGDSETLAEKIENQEYRNRLRAILAGEAQSTSNTLQSILQLGAEWLKVENGHLARIDPAEGTHTITEVSSSHPVISRGSTADLSTTYCRRVIAQNDALAVENAPEQGWKGDPAYEKFDLSTYLGAKVVVEGDLYGTVCFVDREPRVEPVTESDAAALALIVRAIGQALERRQHEARLRRTTAQLEALFEASPNMINIHDLAGNLIAPNPRLRHETGYEAEELTRMKVWDLDEDITPERAQASWRTMEPGDRRRWEGRYRRKDGSSFPVEVDLRRLDLDGKDRFVAIARDISDRKDTEQALREERDRLATLFHNLPTPVVHGWPDDEGRLRVQAINEAFEAVFGIDEDDLQAADLQARIVPPDEQEEADSIRRWLLAGEPVDREVRRETTDGTRDFRVQVALREGEGGPAEGYAIYTDITEQKRREQVLQERREKVEALYRATNRLLTADHPEAVADRIHEVQRAVFEYPLNAVDLVRDGLLVPERVALEEDHRMPEVQPLEVGGESLAARVHASRETMVVEDLHALDNEIDYGDLRSAAGVPIGGHGVILIGQMDDHPFDDFDLHLLEILASHAAAALDLIERTNDLSEERDLLNRIFETSPAAITVFNEDGEFVRASARAEDILGLERDEVTDRTYNDPRWNITAPGGDPMPDEELPFVQVMATGEPVRDVEHAIEWPDGTRRLLSVSGAPLRTSEGDLEGAVFQIEDITERRATERALRQSEARFRKTFENAAIGIAIGDEEGRILESNPAFQAMMGYDEEDLRGRHFAEYTHPDDAEKEQAYFDELRAGVRDRYQLEKRYVRDDGDVFWGRLTVSRHEANRVIGMVEDIDEQKRQEKELRAAKEEAERLNRMKSAFLANMSHEIRTPLTSIIGFADAIGEEVEALEEDTSSSPLDHFAELIEESGHRLLETLDAVLNLSRLEAGEMELSLEPVNLVDEAAEANELFEPRALEKDIDLLVEIPSTPIWARADEGLLRIVLQNLISNALKYTEEGGTVWIRAQTDDGDALLEVEDTGIGMAPNRVPELFEPFRQASEGTSREYEGTGLGLAVTKEAVERMGASITVDTAEGEGSCFSVRFPQADRAP
jgi:PAS domain S-box-containing protein